jgi:Ca2+-binding EF-hand superfamily protein
MSSKDTNGEIRKTFDRYDADANGQIDLVEFRYLLDYLGADLEPAEAEVVFDAIDIDDNGLIDFDEFAEWWETACLGG